MKRKVIQIADSTQLISLPRKWVLKNNIKKGQTLELDVLDEKIMISAAQAAQPRKIELDVTKLKTILPRILHALYKVGYDEVKLVYDDPAMLDLIQDRLHEEIIGFEVVSQAANHCILKSSADNMGTELNLIVSRIFMLLKTMTDGILEIVEKRNSRIASSIRRLEGTNNKYTGYARRMINQGSGHSVLIYCVIEELEKIADEQKYFCDWVKENPEVVKEFRPEIVQLYGELKAYTDESAAAFANWDINTCSELFMRRKLLLRQAKLLRADNNMRTNDFVALHFFMVIIQKLANVNSFRLQMSL